MTLDDLQKIYHAAWRDDEGYNPQRAGVTAIVRALAPDDDEVAAYTRLTLRVRKEMPCECEYLPEDRCISCEVAAALTCLEKRYHEILDSDAGEKVAGGSTREDERSVGQLGATSSHATTSPATDAAPAVCVWTGEEYVTYSTSCESEHEVDPHKAPPTYCPSCGKPIEFTEAK